METSRPVRISVAIMKQSFSKLRRGVEAVFAYFGLGMRAKLIALFIVIKVIPLILLALVAWKQAWELGELLKERTGELSAKALAALSEAGDIAVRDATVALDNRATDEIERMSTDTARQVANFLYARDRDILLLASFEPDESVYRSFVQNQTGRLVQQGTWALSEDGKSWVIAGGEKEKPKVASSIEENDHSFHYRPPDGFSYEDRPLYLEATFVDLQGKEHVKAVTSKLMNQGLANVSDRRNTFVRAETYFDELKKLKPGEIYVSDVIGEYIGTNLIGMYTPENCAKRGVLYEPEKQAFAGQENPYGRRFKGLVRWATPVERQGKIIGYVTLALDHDHIMEFTDHIIPTSERYVEISDAYEGNYAFIWDYKGRSIVHPRHHSITGFDAESGDPQVPWLEDRIYDEWQASGLPYPEFIKDVSTFVAQSNKKKPAQELTKKGLVGLDCRYLNFAPQCTGWFDLANTGGSGSFLILWSGLWKLNTAAAIPYYTGNYGNSKVGFGFVAIGAGLNDFHRPATETQKILRDRISATDNELDAIVEETYNAIGKNLTDTAWSLSLSTAAMAALVVFIAIWLASLFTGSIKNMIRGISRFRSGERTFRFNAPVKDEMGALADSFDEMADSIVASVQVPMTILDLDGNIKYMNDQAQTLSDVDLEKAIGKPYTDYSVFTRGTPSYPLTALEHGVEAEVLYHEGRKRYLRGTASYLTNKNGEKLGIVVTTADVTDFINEQKRIEEQRILLSTIFLSSPDLIWYQDTQGRLLAVNPRFAGILGLPSEEIIGRAFADLLPEKVVAVIRENNKAAYASSTPVYTEERFTYDDGHTETLDIVRTPIFDTSSKALIGLLGFGRDVSRRVKVETELRRTQGELEKAAVLANRASESKTAFLARMSHEIRTPMNAIIGMTNITKRKLLDDKTEKDEILAHIRQIETSSAHLLGLLNDILDISKIEAGKIEINEESFNLPKLVSSVESIIRPRCQEKNLAFTIEEQGLIPGNYVSDPLRLRQVLINLLGNAVKFTPECGEIIFTLRNLERQDGRDKILFSVRDNGIGISKSQVAMLFKPFEQLGGHITRQYGGSGLGLSISQSIVHMLGGDIRVQSEEGKGSTFSFDLWLTEDSGGKDAAKDIDWDISQIAGKHVLLVDDVEINRIIVVEQLSETGVVIDEAPDGVAAVNKFMASEPGFYDMIFMDVQMPNMNGYDASRAIRALNRPDAVSVPIIAMTANAFKEDVEQAFASGMNGHLAKPLEADKLMELLFSFFGQRMGV
ncbi:MAG: PAS domain S-box protein [Desulfovibrio sp.]|jgi:PAS domain S-box-containing protein|nr:PAS domain S-box protein [Desulfovibrio sp.]